MATQTDRELVELAREEPVAGFRQIYDKYWELLFNMAVKRLQDAAEAQDLVQEVFMTLWNQLHTLEPRDSLLPYLQVLLRNRILNIYARNEVKLKYILQLQDDVVTTHENTAQLVALKEVEELLEKAIRQLPPKMQQIFRMSREEQMTPAQIAAQLSLSVQTVKNQLSRATEKVRRIVGIHVNPAVLLLVLPAVTPS
ncbi:RNA polymerase sigma-70 factor [Chitinophaga lutea]|uniref:RNA polymerase sigma-70 factor n=1 Tax=Chitinophaga lutea TaxID=2488634 RepID=A0A3N4PYY4_9BACT|nr:RNA polymerase sigma-70 factor [Chitinophaga lutea]RPE13952.1 RNA polymerase sigma-70 factor [Chitinophaga lutea]